MDPTNRAITNNYCTYIFHLSPTSSHLHPLQAENCDSNLEPLDVISILRVNFFQFSLHCLLNIISSTIELHSIESAVIIGFKKVRNMHILFKLHI